MNRTTFLRDFKENHLNQFKDISEYLFYHPELKFKEFQSVEFLISRCKELGFTVKENVANIETAFIASYGSGKPVIAILGEYDALPGLYQTPNLSSKNDEGKAVGHGCGHNLLGTGALMAASMVKDYISKNHLNGTIRFYGCPGEKIGSGKTFMVRDGAFDDVDYALCWHPSPSNSVMNLSSLANYLVNFHFKGISSHAANSPHLGRSALDAVELMNVGSNYLREHVTDDVRFHYALHDVGSSSPSVVQDTATVQYLIRAKTIDGVNDVYKRIKQIAKGASLMTETDVEIDFVKGCSNYIPNAMLGDQLYKSMHDIYKYNASSEDENFAKDIFNSLSENEQKNKITSLVGFGFMDTEESLEGKYIYDKISPYKPSDEILSGSTDVSDVSWVVPTGQVSCATSAIGTPLHTWQMTSQGLSNLAFEGTSNAAMTMAHTAIELLQNKDLRASVDEEFKTFQSKNVYKNPIPKEVLPR
ncbi:amidohydrolase [Mammaliicoccus stepanovicii]|uniref:HmrA protein involved in methicillin resistance/amidohydrolase of M40 family n=1 Tax=Mammaliicoccus stepanovicii TaxID=643214 RepID=A0A240A7J5_9STAP|nr:amidohydrolase [Mammaliicoccus stepanovicii]PNZ78033.1 amidohydrolase [Mammaliicoccus stepanovicii]GGI39603.1 p-aminobenzoyl-glutamate hydrolase subunit B [Mammaliicoccus stepanovicii]SNV78923.1 HmrA protein involved in methicillin resistance/amidohydrolase of M40 family [Mammaliicoccus stepanovicii]